MQLLYVISINLSYNHSELALLSIGEHCNTLFVMLLLVGQFVYFRIEGTLPEQPVAQFLLLHLHGLYSPFLLFYFLDTAFLFLFQFGYHLFMLSNILLHIHQVLFQLLQQIFIIGLLYLLVLQYLLINNHNDQQQHHSYHRNGVYPPFSLELFFPYLRVGIPIGLLLQFRSHIGGIDRIFQLGADFQIFQSFLHISLLLGYGIQVKEREIPDMNIDSFLASVQIIKSRIKLPVIIIKFP